MTVNGRKIKRGVRLWNIGTSMLKLELYGQVQLPKPVDGEEYPEGYVFLPDGMSDELIKQLVSEELRIKRRRNGTIKQEWHKIRDRNEALDNAVYARAVAIGLGADLWTPRQWAKLMGQISIPKPRPAPKPGDEPQSPPTSSTAAPPPSGGDWIGGGGRSSGGSWL